RNIDLLADPSLRDRFLIVAVQTVLKPLLARGIRPHLVTALDHSEISRRFYEGLSADDLRGITLVVDPKVNPAVLDAWPRGADLRIQSDKYLDRLLGPDLTRPRGTLKPGATVAHLAYYVARHCGCDPVALIGQDLGFTDGQYYSAGAAIHAVWAAELNEFNTLEMLEWHRIVRMGQHLRRAVDVLGRPIYTDEQMATYLVQFERDFHEDAQRGLRTVDATEGGVLKRHTTPARLAEYLSEHRDAAPNPVRIPAARAPSSSVSLRRIDQRVAEVRAGAFRVAEISRRTGIVLSEIHEHQKDQQRVNRLIARTEELGAEVARHEPALSLCHVLNQTGSFNRVRADRSIQLESQDGKLDPFERQRRQVERDRENVRALAASADALGELLDDTLRTLRGGERVTRDRAAPTTVSSDRQGAAVEAREVRTAAVVPVFADRGELAEEMLDGLNVIETTIAALAACRSLGFSRPAAEGPARSSPGVSRIVVLTDNPDSVRRWIRSIPDGLKIEFVRADSAFTSRRAAVRAARILSGECWRGGVANLSVYDEVFEPISLAEAMRSSAPPIDAALLVGPDWCAVQPALCDSVVARFIAEPDRNRFAFTQAAPGLAGCVVARSLVESLAAAARTASAGTFASIGGLLGYIPGSPQMDLANMPECVAVDPALRDLGQRLIADSQAGRDRLRAYAAKVRGESPSARTEPASACHLVLELVRGWNRLAPETARRAVEELADACDEGVVTLRGGDVLAGDDPLAHPDTRALAQHARQLGLGVHVRTPLTTESDSAWLIDDPAVDVVSVDLLAHSQDAYHALTGRGPDFARV
ncbi:MAG: 6-hydroxymethylpterin diphosphokinase MptE-like protein, partial [Phycisphaerales bacterium]